MMDDRRVLDRSVQIKEVKKQSTEACQGGGGGVSHPLSLKFRGQLSLIPKITETVISKTTYLWNLTTGGNFKV